MDPGGELFEAIAAGDVERALALVRERPDLAGERDDQGVSAVMQALYRGQDELVAALCEARPELDVFEAAALGDTDRLATLVEADPALVLAWSADGFTPLHFAAFLGRPDAARVLIVHGADLEVPARNDAIARDARPLHSATAARQLAACAVLLEAGADPNARQHVGYTPLLEAAQRGDAVLVELLLEHGADRSATLDDGRGAGELAAAAGADELAERLP